jgi:2,4-dienoyl-CoA reductase-like NADH-dependent reductase (Old Yellow Enzyme family)
MAGLFDAFEVRGVTLKNRIVMPPMCLWTSGPDGEATDWHLVHYGARAVGGVGLIIVEVSAVERRGRIDDIDPGDLGIWNDRHVEPLARIARFCKEQGAVVAIQIGHAGRKANGEHKGHGGEQSVAPSAIPFDEGWRPPHEPSKTEISKLVDAFVAAARRAVAAGFQAIEVHGAHGYLISSFLSPLANKRADEYGGGIDRRSRFACDVTQAVRAEIPDEMPLLVRVSGTDWHAEGNTVEDMAVAARLLKDAGADVIHVSAGGNSPQAPPTHPGYMVRLADTIRHKASVPTVAVGLIRTPEMAESIIRNGRADLVALGRELLRSPQWPLNAARELGVDLQWPEQYEQAKL